MKQCSFLELGFLVVSMLLLASCNVSPQPITYGKDGCHFCSMTIVDRQHAAELVTKKGKIFKFDAAECMVNHLKEIENSSIAHFLVNDYNKPGELINATQVTYLISEGIASPMGEFLTAFKTKEDAEKAWLEHEGELYTWEELLIHLK